MVYEETATGHLAKSTGSSEYSDYDEGEVMFVGLSSVIKGGAGEQELRREAVQKRFVRLYTK